MEKIKKICIVSAGILPVPDVMGGAVEHLITMISNVNETEHKFDITVITCPNKEAFVKQRKYKYTHFVNLKSYNSKLLKKWIAKINWHINHHFHRELYILNYINSPFCRYLVKKRNSFDLVIGECPGTDFCGLASLLTGRKHFTIHLHANVFASPNLERTYGNVISVSDFIMKQYREKSTLPQGRVLTVFNGIETENFKKKISTFDRKSLRHNLGFSDNDFILIFCGRIVADKGVRELINALLMINIDKIKLLILGSSNFGLGDSGNYPQEIKALVNKAKDRIKFTGYIDNRDVYKYHKIADVGIMPSMHNDPCPLSLFELITSGLPTIATRAGGMPEIGNENTTIFVSMDNIIPELKEGILKLFYNPILRESMSKAAVIRSTEFTKQRFYADFCNTINHLIALNYDYK